MTSSQHQINRIEHKITTLQTLSRRISWLRLSAFLGGVALTWIVAASAGSLVGGLTFVLASVLFTVLVVIHRRLDHQERRLRILQDMARQQIARQTLTWEGIPLPAAVIEPRLPHDIDLDLTGPHSLHHLLDTAISRQGSARLAAWLTNEIPDPQKITARQAIVGELARLPGFRQHLTLIFRLISRQPLDAEKLLAWLQTPFDAARLPRLLPIATPLALINVTLFGLSLTANWPPFWALTSALYGLLYAANLNTIGEFLGAIVRLDDELMPFQALLGYLERYPYGNANHLAELCAPFRADPLHKRSSFLQQPSHSVISSGHDVTGMLRPRNGLSMTRRGDGFGVSELPTSRLRRLKWVTAAAGVRMNPVIGLLINLIVPWDFWAAWLAARQQEQMAHLLPIWLDTFHELEALISLGNFAALNPGYVFPKISPVERRTEFAVETAMGGLDRLDQRLSPVERRAEFVVETAGSGLDKLDQRLSPVKPVETARMDAVFSVRSLGHPLLLPGQKVCNDFTINALGELALITGSNMAGKSTFIRTVGVNLCLAYAGGPVSAAAWHSLPFRLYTCIRISDSLGDGFSYFYAEVKRLKGLLDALKDPSSLPLLYLIDEIFRGTNNRERLIGSRAYVRALIGCNGLGLIATHDLELAALADVNPQVHNYHFRDEVQAGKLTFDYHIHPGPSPTTNALQIMALEGLPI